MTLPDGFKQIECVSFDIPAPPYVARYPDEKITVRLDYIGLDDGGDTASYVFATCSRKGDVLVPCGLYDASTPRGLITMDAVHQWAEPERQRMLYPPRHEPETSPTAQDSMRIVITIEANPRAAAHIEAKSTHPPGQRDYVNGLHQILESLLPRPKPPGPQGPRPMADVGEPIGEGANACGSVHGEALCVRKRGHMTEHRGYDGSGMLVSWETP